jgi:UDP-N-acetylglucosamine 2-epimerase (non-hydrolysing)
MVITDSGGLQEETTVLGVPCITLRHNTERPITCEVGTNIIVGNNSADLLAQTRKVLAGEMARGRVPEKWDGKAADRIADILGRAMTDRKEQTMEAVCQ